MPQGVWIGSGILREKNEKIPSEDELWDLNLGWEIAFMHIYLDALMH